MNYIISTWTNANGLFATGRNKMEMPIVRLELERMKQTIMHAFVGHQFEIKEMVEHALQEAVRPENIKHQIDSMTRNAVQEAIKASINSFFVYGEGRNFIKQVAEQKLKDELHLMGFDDNV